MENQNKATITATAIFFAIQCATLAGFVKQHEKGRIFGIITITVLFLLFTFLKVKYKIDMKVYITWFVIITIIGHNLIGEYLKIYLSSFIYDKVLHFWGTYAFAMFFYAIIIHLFPEPVHSKGREFIFIVLLGASLGMVLELIEFFGDIIYKPKIPNQNDLLDTDIDMIADIVGALAAGIHAYVKKFSMFSHS